MIYMYERKIKSIDKNKLSSIITEKINNIFTYESYQIWAKDNFGSNSENISFDLYLDVHNKTKVKVMNAQILVELKLKIPPFRESKEKLSNLLFWFKDEIQKYGWFVSKPFDSDLEEIAYDYIEGHSKSSFYLKILLEPYYGQIIDNIPKKIYHISEKYNTDGILKKGLVPKSDERLTQYPDRVYVLLSLDRINDLILGLIQNEFPLVDIHQGNIQTPKISSIGEYLSLFEINTNKLRKGTKFFKDPDMPTGAWTYTHIPPEAINLLDIDKVV